MLDWNRLPIDGICSSGDSKPRAGCTAHADLRVESRRRERARRAQRGLFDCENWGGTRKGAGRKAQRRRDGKRVHNSHSRRQKVVKSRPLHVTVNFIEGLPNLRREGLAEVVLGALEARPRGEGFRVVHFALLSNHLHLICEAQHNGALTAGMRGLNVRVARAVNRKLGRKGRVVAERFHLHVLQTKREVRNAVNYVLRNGERHGAWDKRTRSADVGRTVGAVGRPDPLSSAAFFPHWAERQFDLSPRQARASVVDAAGTWLLLHAFDDSILSLSGEAGRPSTAGKGGRAGADRDCGRGGRAAQVDPSVIEGHAGQGHAGLGHAGLGRSAPNQDGAARSTARRSRSR